MNIMLINCSHGIMSIYELRVLFDAVTALKYYVVQF